MAFFTKCIVAVAMAGFATIASADKLPLNDISNYLNGLKTASGEFTQFNEDGSTSTGTLLIKRPGRMRFEYNPPETALVFANNGAVVIIDRKSNLPPETYPLKRTPLSLILARKVDLDQAKMVVGHDYDGTSTIVRAQDPNNPETGFIDLMFTNNPIELHRWKITDSNGGQTTVELGELTKGERIPNRLFSIEQR